MGGKREENGKKGKMVKERRGNKKGGNQGRIIINRGEMGTRRGWGATKVGSNGVDWGGLKAFSAVFFPLLFFFFSLFWSPSSSSLRWWR